MSEKNSPRKVDKIVAVKGMNDILPGESAKWEWLEATVRSLMSRYAYRNIRTPIVEPTALFVRGLGEVTDHHFRVDEIFGAAEADHSDTRCLSRWGHGPDCLTHSLCFGGRKVETAEARSAGSEKPPEWPCFSELE